MVPVGWAFEAGVGFFKPVAAFRRGLWCVGVRWALNQLTGGLGVVLVAGWAGRGTSGLGVVPAGNGGRLCTVGHRWAGRCAGWA